MNPEKIWAVSREVWRFTKKHAKYAGLSLLVACAPQPKQEQAQQEPQIPKDATVLVVTNTLTPDLPTATPEPTNTPKPELAATATPEPPKAQQSLFPNEAVFAGDLLPKKGGVAFYHRKGDMVIAVAVKQDCLDGEPEKMSVVLMTNPGEINGLQLNRRWSNIGSINGRFMEPQNSLNGFLRLNQSTQRNCPPQEFTFLATNRGSGTEAFLMSYNKVLESINILPVTSAAALVDINSACPRCKLVPEGK